MCTVACHVLAGVPVADRAVLRLAASLSEAELLDTAELLERAYDREARIVALDIRDREAILRVLEDCPEEMLELRATLHQEHVWRKRVRTRLAVVTVLCRRILTPPATVYHRRRGPISLDERREASMAVIRIAEQPLGLENRPEWCQIPRAGFFHMPREGGEHDLHYHDSNELYLICRGKAKILNAANEYYVRAGDIVCIKAGEEHDILEIYGDEDFELFWLYEPSAHPVRFTHLHRTVESARRHPVPAKPVPPDFPD